jgi:hypothetical protein
MNRTLKAAVLILLAVVTLRSMANGNVSKLQCDNVQIEIYNSNVPESPFFVVTIHARTTTRHVFEVTEELLEARCERSKTGESFLLLNHFCAGSGCAESNYALIALSTGKEELHSSERWRGNADRAAAILGKPVAPFMCNQHSRDSSEPNAWGEVCVISPIELD